MSEIDDGAERGGRREDRLAGWWRGERNANPLSPWLLLSASL